MSTYVVAPDAEDDLLNVWRYYAEETNDPDLADRVSNEFVSAFRSLARSPGIGHLRHDLSEEPLRFWSVRRYLVIYREMSGRIEIVRILHSARDVQAILNG